MLFSYAIALRLVSLERDGIIIKESKESNSRCEYSLTDKGRDLLPILHTMQVWGEKYATTNF